MKKIAFLFPGQGSQSVGMGRDLFEQYDVVKQIFDMASEISGISMSKLCFNGPMGELTMTINLQPAVTAVNLACLAVISKEGVRPDMTAGHSLGEFTALFASDVLTREDTVRLVLKRGELMHRESLKQKGAMHAVIGLPIEEVRTIVAEAQNEGIVSVANHNTETQIVITGAPGPVKKASGIAAARGARFVPLKVSGAWHSPLIEGAREEFRAYLKTITFRKPSVPVVHNVTADTETDPEKIRSLMADQLVSPVRWFDTIRKMVDEGIDTFVEIGPGKVLSGLVKQSLPSGYPRDIRNISDMKTLDRFLNSL